MKLFGDRDFMKKVMAVSVPIMIQNGITNFVNLLDNIMVGQCGTEQMSGVSIANQVLMVYMLCIFGATSGAGIFGAQFYGKNDHEGVMFTFRFKMVLGAVLFALGVTLMVVFGDFFIDLFLQGEAGSTDIAATAKYSYDYMFIILFGLLPFTVSSSYAGTLREGGETLHPMIASLSAVVTNFVFNYLLIFGKLGLPEMGVLGAAIATNIARYVECFYLVIWTNRNKHRFPFIRNAFRSMRIPWGLTKKIAKKGMPLLINETMFALGMTTMTQCYSVKGAVVLAALNIVNVAANLFRVVFSSLGSAVAIICGQLLGAGKMDEARKAAFRMTAFSVVASAAMGGLLAITAPFFPKLYNTTDEIRTLATTLMLILSFILPLDAFCNSAYFALRSGGKTLITFVFDSVALWAVTIPLAYFLGHHTAMDIVSMYFIVNIAKLAKVTVGFFMLRSNMWLHNIVNENK